MPLLSGLESVPWAALHHAYGPATDVPDLLRGICDPDAARRRAVWSELFGNLWHQGTIYEATPHAVPFLIELAGASELPEREWVLFYLAALATGQSYWACHKALADWLKDDPKIEIELAAQLGWVKETREAVCRGYDVYVGCLGDKDSMVRAGAAHLLGILDGDVDGRGPLRRAFDRCEPDEMVRTALVYGFWYCGKPTEDDGRWLSQITRSDPSLAVRTHAALGVAKALAASAEAHVVDLLLDTVRDPAPQLAVHKSLPWDRGELAHVCAAALFMTCVDRLAIHARLLGAMQRAPEGRGWLIGQRMISQAFPSSNYVNDEPLTDEQKFVVDSLKSSNKIRLILQPGPKTTHIRAGKPQPNAIDGQPEDM